MLDLQSVHAVAIGGFHYEVLVVLGTAARYMILTIHQTLSTRGI